MRVEQALERFRQLCTEAGLDPDHLSPRPAWDVFTAFLREPVDVVHDGASFQCGPADGAEHSEAFAAFVRLFSDAAAEEDDEELLEAIVTEFDFAPTRAAAIRSAEVHSHEFGSIAEFIRHVEAMPEFEAIMNLEPLRSEIYTQEL